MVRVPRTSSSLDMASLETKRDLFVLIGVLLLSSESELEDRMFDLRFGGCSSESELFCRVVSRSEAMFFLVVAAGFLVTAAGFLVTAAGFLVAPGALAAFSLLFNLKA